jgi:localization factor PodJL
LEQLARVAGAPHQPPAVEAPREPHDPPLTGAPTLTWTTPSEPHDVPVDSAPPPVREMPSKPLEPPLTVAPPRRRRASAAPAISIDDAVAEIAARQRVLDGDPAVADETVASAEAPTPGPALDFGSLERLLRQITARVEALQPSHEIESAIAALRSDLAEIGRQLNEALPRRALESLESEIKALAERIDFSRQAGVDPDALAGIERGLAEVHEALRGLTPAENLVGADEAVHALAQKVDMILARDDPAMLQQLEAAIGGLRGVVSHVASNDTLNQVAEDVRVLAAQVDAIANNAATSHAVASLEQRIDALTAALQASGEVGRTVPHAITNDATTAHAVASLEQRIDALTAALQESSAAGQTVQHDIANDPATAHAVASLEQRIDVLTAALQTSSAAGQAAPHDIGTDAPTAHTVASLEQRIDALTAALQTSSEAGRAVPQDLEKLLGGLIDKLEWVQLTHTDHAALAHLEDRIAMLVKRFDASEARFGQLEAIERGLADLLVHVEQLRGAGSPATAEPAAWRASPPAFDEPVTALKQSEPHAAESHMAMQDVAMQGMAMQGMAMQDTVEHVANRLAMIESNVYDSAAFAAPAKSSAHSEPPLASQHAAAEHIAPSEIVSLLTAAPAEPAEMAAAPVAAPALQPAPRPPIDPSLPPDHPLEPGFTGSRPRPVASAAERVAASGAAIGSAKPPVIPDAGRPNFIAAARRAAQAASWEPSTTKAKHEPELADNSGQPSKLSQRLRKLIVAGSALLIVVGCARIAMRLMDDGRTIGSLAPIQSERSAAPAAPVPAPAPLAQKAPAGNYSAAQVPALPLFNPADAAAPQRAPAPAKTVKPEQQSLQQDGAHETVANAAPPADVQPAGNALPLWATPDITGTLPHSLGSAERPRAAAPAPAAAANDDELPASIGDPALRAAAFSGDPAAAYEIAARFAEGRGVPKDNAAAAHWLERAAKQGLAPAQFRLGGLYEKGIGVKKDLARARELYLAAADKGNGKAMHNLAVLYAEGVDGAPDYTSAAEWFRRGADHGVSDSQYNLGILYGRGIGVTQDYAESYKWFALAANQGDHDAANKRDEVAGHLDAQALAAARTAVQNFKPEPQPDDAINVKTAAAWQRPANTQAPKAK